MYIYEFFFIFFSWLKSFIKFIISLPTSTNLDIITFYHDTQSVVVVTTRPLYALYHTMAGIIARCYFATGRPAVASACAEIALWPSIRCCMMTDLFLLGEAIKVPFFFLNGNVQHRSDPFFKYRFIKIIFC